MNRLENGVRKALRGAVDHLQGLDTGGVGYRGHQTPADAQLLAPGGRQCRTTGSHQDTGVRRAGAWGVRPQG